MKSTQQDRIEQRVALEDDALAALGNISAQRLWLYCPESIADSATMSMKQQMHRCLRWSRKHSEAFDFGLWKMLFWHPKSNRSSMRKSLARFREKEFSTLEVLVVPAPQSLIALQSQALAAPKPFPLPIAESLATAAKKSKSSGVSKKSTTSSRTSSK
jgi:hypothetical protein